MYNVKNIRHGVDFGKMDKKSVLAKWPQADLTGKPFRAGKFTMTCEPIKKRAKKAAPKTETPEDNG